MRHTGLEHGIDVGLAVEPIEKGFHLLLKSRGWRRFIVHPFATDARSNGRPLCSKTIASSSRRKLAHVAPVSSAFWSSSKTKCVGSAYFSTVAFQMPRSKSLSWLASTQRRRFSRNWSSHVSKVGTISALHPNDAGRDAARKNVSTRLVSR